MTAELQLICDAVRAGGQEAMSWFEGAGRSALKASSKADGSPVTAADIAVNEALRARLMGALPEAGWLSEESADGPDRMQRERVFVVDPIDGTVAFLRGRADWSISVALVEHGRTLAAAVMQPALGRLFSAHRGAGAQMNGQAITASQRASLDGARLVNSRHVIEDAAWSAHWPAFEHAKLSSIALRLATIAEGTMDAMIRLRPVYEWDIAAGVLLLEESGGIATDLDGEPLRFNQAQPRAPSLLAAGAALHASILRGMCGIERPKPDASA